MTQQPEAETNQHVVLASEAQKSESMRSKVDERSIDKSPQFGGSLPRGRVQQVHLSARCFVISQQSNQLTDAQCRLKKIFRSQYNPEP
jgi:hypothetical protein